MKNETLITIYSNSEFMGNIIKHEGKLIEQGTKKYAQYDNAPYVKFIQKGKRKPVQIQKSSSPTLVILEGYGHIDPPADSKIVSQTAGVTVKESLYVCFDERYNADFDKVMDAYLSNNKVNVIADYRYTKGFNSYHKSPAVAVE